MNSAVKKSLCVIQLLGMSCSVQADWTHELKDIFKICAIAGASIFIYAKWFGQPKLVDNSSSAMNMTGKEDVASYGGKIEKLNGEIENLKHLLAESAQKKDNRESEVIVSNSFYDRQNQEDNLSSKEIELLKALLQKTDDTAELELQDEKNNLSSEEIEKIRKFLKEGNDTPAPDYEKLFTLLNTSSNQIVELTQRQINLEQQHNQFKNEQVRMAKILSKHNTDITQHTKIIGDGVEDAAITDLVHKLNEFYSKQHTDMQAQSFDEYLEESTSSSQALTGSDTIVHGKVNNFTQLCALLITSFLELNGKFMKLKKAIAEEFPSMHGSIIFAQDDY